MTDYQSVALGGWQLARCAPGLLTNEALGFDDGAGATLDWRAATVPGTVAESLHHDLDQVGHYDAHDWWYRCAFARPTAARVRVRFDGLATLARVWLNGTAILTSRNMFVAASVDITALLEDHNVLVMVFESLEAALRVRRARPRWKTALVENQNLRWFRTTLLGRIPGWTPPITPVGPWRPITLECRERFEVTRIDLQVRASGKQGLVAIRARVELLPGHRLEGALLRIDEHCHDLQIVDAADGSLSVSGDLTLSDVNLWWPHTHGAAPLYDCVLELTVDGAERDVPLGRVGFKEVTLDTADGVRFVVNGEPVFCRGASWTTSDIVTLRSDPAGLRRVLTRARDAGLNMLRIGGTMVYESTAFYELCDELGILVWQDFMFANMDYPVDDAAFLADIDREARHQLGRLQRHVCIAAYCGGSEVAQQAAMVGRPAEEWTNRFFAETLAGLCADRHATIPYFPSTPWGGALPFHVRTGISNYYGIGAYRRPLSDVKHAGVKFTTECLGFSNVPDRETMALMHEGKTLPPHHPLWKARQPRDSGPGWDFEDIRDHYCRALFDLDPIALRSVDVERYYAVSRVVTGEVMQRVFSEWRTPGNPCGGGLVWFFQDLWPGAGWGIIDSTGRPKAVFWYLRRAWAPRAVRLIDAGLDGLDVVLINEDREPLQARVELCLYQQGEKTGTGKLVDVEVAGRGSSTLSADALLGFFCDLTRAYRFGPPAHDLVGVRLHDRRTGELVGEDFYFPGGLGLPRHRHAPIESALEWVDGQVCVTLRSAVFLQSVCVSCRDFEPSDNYFHLAPDTDKRLVFSPLKPGSAQFKAELDALNVGETVVLRGSA